MFAIRQPMLPPINADFQFSSLLKHFKMSIVANIPQITPIAQTAIIVRFCSNLLVVSIVSVIIISFCIYGYLKSE